MPEGKVPFVLDASAITNFLGSGIPEQLFESLDAKLVVASQAFREVMHDPSRQLPLQSWLKDIKSRHLIEIATPSDNALEDYLKLASEPPPNHLDDSEAATMALAIQLGAIPVLDAERARRICQAFYPAHPLSSTAGLFHRASMTGRISQDELRCALLKALRIAEMQVITEMIEWVIHTIGEEDAKLCPSLPAKFPNLLGTA